MIFLTEILMPVYNIGEKKEELISVWGNDDFFGGMFDFNGDGRTDAVEAALGCQILDEMEQENIEKEGNRT